MNQQLMRLFQAVNNLPPRPDDMAAFVATAPEAGTLPPPELAWLVFALMAYRQRQAWACGVLRRRVVRPLRQSRAGRLSRRELLRSRAEGPVPGLPGWYFRLGVADSVLRHEGTAEEIRVRGLRGPDPVNLITLYGRIMQQREPGPAELRLRRLLLGDFSALHFAAEIIARHGLLEQGSPWGMDLRLRLPSAYIEPVRAFLSAWSVPTGRPWLGAVIGDWIAVEEAAQSQGMPDLAAQAAPRAEACRAAWLDLVRREADDQMSPAALDAVSIYLPEQLPRHIERVLTDPEPAHETVDAALRLANDDPVWCPAVYRLLVRARDYLDG